MRITENVQYTITRYNRYELLFSKRSLIINVELKRNKLNETKEESKIYSQKNKKKDVKL